MPSRVWPRKGLTMRLLLAGDCDKENPGSLAPEQLREFASAFGIRVARSRGRCPRGLAPGEFRRARLAPGRPAQEPARGGGLRPRHGGDRRAGLPRDRHRRRHGAHRAGRRSGGARRRHGAHGGGSGHAREIRQGGARAGRDGILRRCHRPPDGRPLRSVVVGSARRGPRRRLRRASWRRCRRGSRRTAASRSP